MHVNDGFDDHVLSHTQSGERKGDQTNIIIIEGNIYLSIYLPIYLSSEVSIEY